jgi:hypothetical protein
LSSILGRKHKLVLFHSVETCSEADPTGRCPEGLPESEADHFSRLVSYLRIIKPYFLYLMISRHGA